MTKILNTIVLSSLLFIGAGCFGRTSTTLDLPTTPPAAQVDASAAARANAEAAKECDPQEKPGCPSEMTATCSDGRWVCVGGAPGTTPVGATVGAEATAKAPYYIAYTAEGAAKARAEGRVTLLYFWASWCPICREEEPKIKTWVEGSGLPVAGFRVNFDIETELKQQYRVAYQHTTIILNARGEETARFTGPTTEAELTAALRAAAGN